MLITLAGIDTLASFEQSLNAKLPMLVRPDDIVTLVSSLQLIKALASTLIT